MPSTKNRESNKTETAKVKKKGQLTLPVGIREVLGIEENDQLEISVVDGRIIMVPTVNIPKDQAWFWTEEWQADEREAQHDIDTGNVEVFSTAEDLIASLRSKD